MKTPGQLRRWIVYWVSLVPSPHSFEGGCGLGTRLLWGVQTPDIGKRAHAMTTSVEEKGGLLDDYVGYVSARSL